MVNFLGPKYSFDSQWQGPMSTKREFHDSKQLCFILIIFVVWLLLGIYGGKYINFLNFCKQKKFHLGLIHSLSGSTRDRQSNRRRLCRRRRTSHLGEKDIRVIFIKKSYEKKFNFSILNFILFSK